MSPPCWSSTRSTRWRRRSCSPSCRSTARPTTSPPSCPSLPSGTRGGRAAGLAGPVPARGAPALPGGHGHRPAGTPGVRRDHPGEAAALPGQGNSPRHRRGDHHLSERDDGIIDLDATIYCEKASHKGIIIGKGGAMLKKISTLARTDIEAFMGTKVFLQTWVKVKENWRDNMNLIKNFRIPGRVRAQKLPLINGTRPANLKTERGLCHELGGAALAAVLQTGLPEVYSLYRRVKG